MNSSIADLPGSSAHLSSRAAHNRPGESNGCLHPASTPSVAGFISVGEVATLT